MKFKEKRKKNKNYEISHIVRPTVTPEVYNQKQNTLFISECVERMHDWVHDRVHSCVCTTECTFRACGSVVRSARLGCLWCTAWSGRVCAWTRPRFFIATHGLVVHGLNFLWMIEPCGWIIEMVTCNLKRKRHATKSHATESHATYICSLPSSQGFFFYSFLLAD